MPASTPAGNLVTYGTSLGYLAVFSHCMVRQMYRKPHARRKHRARVSISKAAKKHTALSDLSLAYRPVLLCKQLEGTALQALCMHSCEY